ncbi:TniB family NTP-binding protein [Rhodopseudomonas sp. NSM]|uniref:TniB family NTP-binding protein n=1 Tax=Rhodopseudomonas sp. NSM TaxID=3457630 RepID=UPI004036081F
MTWSTRSVEERRKHIGSFVAVTPTMKRATDVFRRCYREYHESQQASCSFVVGETGVGKTTAANDFMEEIREEYRGTLKDGIDVHTIDPKTYPTNMSVTFQQPGRGLVRPILKIMVSKKTTYKQLFGETLAALGMPTKRATLAEMKSIVRRQIEGQGVRMIIFDECQHIVDSSQIRDPYEAADFLKELMKETRVQICCVGLHYATDFLLENGQLETMKSEEHHMRPFPLDFSESAELCMFLRSLSDDLPFDRKPQLFTPAQALRLHLASDGYVGYITKYVSMAAKDAIDQNLDTVTMDLIGDAYARKHNVPDKENPFRVKGEIDEDGFQKIKAARRKMLEEEAFKSRAARRRKEREKSLRKAAAAA